jgi:anhydro-N-acetylmuramic acid kinase
MFGEPFFEAAMRAMRRLPAFDQVATLTEFTARSLALNYQLHLPSPPSRLILTGGGAANPVLARAIGRQFDGEGVEILTSETLGWPVQAIEPAAFALLAHLRAEGRPGNLPQTTGASRGVLLGQESGCD